MKAAFTDNTAPETGLKDAISKSCRMSQSNGMPPEMLFKGEIST